MSVKQTKDKRTIRTGADYTKFRRELFDLQHGRCADCGAYTAIDLDPATPYSFHVHHKNGRGMGGGKRDDTVEACNGLCRDCHQGEHQ